ncbi:MAG TPA: hypothetical protein VMB21_05885 [Candidatus Limnocylindria bacterium]|nr:hypothetical protein [Candidatus Limnocylindria bacterium]
MKFKSLNRFTLATATCALLSAGVLTTQAGDSPFGGLGAAVADAGKTSLASLGTQFTKTASASSDKVLGSLGGDLVSKFTALDQSLGMGSALKSQLTGSLQSLLAGKDSAALGTAFGLSQFAGLTATQKDLAKEAGNLATAFVVQRNFASLDGASGDVATVVNSLRKGELVTAVPAIQKISQNASLTAPQKALIGSIADKYAPGLRKTKDALQQGLQGVKSLPGFGN